jgi:hypothetical protein
VLNNPINYDDHSGLCPPGLPQCRDEQGRPIDAYYIQCPYNDPGCYIPRGTPDPETWEILQDRGFIPGMTIPFCEYNDCRDIVVKWALFFNDHYVSQKLIKHYVGGSGKDFELTPQQMMDINPSVDIGEGKNFKNLLQKEGRVIRNGGTIKINNLRGPASARTNGTLGNFSAFYDGDLRSDDCDPGGWIFEGTVRFHDRWNFDAKKTGERNLGAELKTWYGRLLPGASFNVESVKIGATQSADDSQITFIDFPDFKPKFGPNRLDILLIYILGVPVLVDATGS